jgi:hypothetical protein
MILCVYRQESQKKDAPQRSHEKYLPSIHEAGAMRETAIACEDQAKSCDA